jgi:hypothetical protein
MAQVAFNLVPRAHASLRLFILCDTSGGFFSFCIIVRFGDAGYCIVGASRTDRGMANAEAA